MINKIIIDKIPSTLQKKWRHRQQNVRSAIMNQGKSKVWVMGLNCDGKEIDVIEVGENK